MISPATQDTLFLRSARTTYRTLRAGHRQLRRLKNSLCNLVDVPLIILIYHRVIALPSDPEMIAVSPRNFSGQLDYLKRHYRIVRFDEDWSEIREPAVAITFDDGYADNLLEALPILEEVGVPATFFVSTAHIGTDRLFWWHRLETLLLRAGEFPSRFELRDPSFGRCWETGSLAQRRVLYVSLGMLMRRIESDRQDAWLNQLQEWAGCTPSCEERHRLMNREELRRLAESPWATIGAHTVSHTALSALPAAQQRQEIFSSKAELEDLTGQEIATFSYPFGRKNEYNRTSVELCRQAGFTRAAANFPGQVHRWSDPLQLPRHLVRNWELETFAGQMRGFWTR